MERTVYKELSHELYIERERYEELVEENRRLRRQLEQMPREAPERVVYKEVPVDRVVYKEVPVEVEKVVYRDAPERVVYRDAPKVATPPPQPSARMVGLGLALERQPGSTQTFVEQIIPGFAAWKSNQFQVGDVVVAVDQQPVDNCELDHIRSLTIGQENTFCTLQMMRGSRYYAVTLQRITPPTLDESNYDAAMRIAPGLSLSLPVSLAGAARRFSCASRTFYFALSWSLAVVGFPRTVTPRAHCPSPLSHRHLAGSLLQRQHVRLQLGRIQ